MPRNSNNGLSNVVMSDNGIAVLTLHPAGWSALACYFLSAGLFGFIGGFTNWLAIAMVFTKVPFLYGSG